MNWTATLLRNELKKLRLAHQTELNKLTSASIDASNYLTLEAEKEQLNQQLNQNQQNLNTSQQNTADLSAIITAKDQSISQLKSSLGQLQQAKKEQAFTLQKENRDYQLYHAREIRRLAKEKKEALKDLSQQVKALTILANHRLDLLEQEKTALIVLAKSKIKNKKEASELLAQLQTKWELEKAELESTIQNLEIQKQELQSASEQELQTQISTYQLQLENAKTELINSQTKWELQKARLDQQDSSLQSKDDRIANQHKIIQISTKILESKIAKFNELMENLENRTKQKDLTSQHLQTLLKADIKWLARERKELTNNLQELEAETVKAKEARDEQILILRETLSKTEEELALEQGWWDKWINHEEDFMYYCVGSELLNKDNIKISNSRPDNFILKKLLFKLYTDKGGYDEIPSSDCAFLQLPTVNDLDGCLRMQRGFNKYLKLLIKRKIYNHYRGQPILTPTLNTEQTGLVATLQSQLNASKEQESKLKTEQTKLLESKEKLLKAKETLAKKIISLESQLAANSPKDSLLQSLKNQLAEALAKLAKKEEKKPETKDPSAILKEIQQFIGTANSLEAIESWLIAKDYPDLKIDLTSKSPTELLILPKDTTAKNTLAKAKGPLAEYKNWIPLQTLGNGNCFLNAFSILLVGDTSLALRLRVALCLLLIQEPWRLGKDTETEQLAALKTKLITEGLAKDKSWLATDDINFLSVILKRPLRVLYFPLKEQFVSGNAEDKAQGELAWKAFQEETGGLAMTEFKSTSLDSEKIEYISEDYWTILHVGGNHFVPLVKGETK